jgi:translation elongation factor EF-Tu-like GTPase
MMRDRIPDIEVKVRFLSTEDGGRNNPIYSGYRPQFTVAPNMQTSGEHQFLQKDIVYPGEEASANILFIAPEHHPKTLWVGKEMEVKEGSRLIGNAVVTKIFNQNLASV